MAQKKKVATLKKGFKWYAIKKATLIGDTVQPIGYKIQLNEDGYEFFKQKKIV